jgi:hypothetical protein
VLPRRPSRKPHGGPHSERHDLRDSTCRPHVLRPPERRYRVESHWQRAGSANRVPTGKLWGWVVAALRPLDYAIGRLERRWETDQPRLEQPENRTNNDHGLDADNLNDARASGICFRENDQLEPQRLMSRSSAWPERPEMGRRPSAVLDAPWSGFPERCFGSTLLFVSAHSEKRGGRYERRRKAKQLPEVRGPFRECSFFGTALLALPEMWEVALPEVLRYQTQSVWGRRYRGL